VRIVFNPVETITGLVNMAISIVLNGLAAYFLPTLELIVSPTLRILAYFTSV
jgi:hypothetical protein